MPKRIYLAVFLMVLFANPAFGQKLIIDVQGVSQPTPVAIIPFGWEGDSPAVPLGVASVIQADLRRSGRFAPTNENDMLQKPTSSADVDFDD